MTPHDDDARTTSPISRRTTLAAAAWTVPVVAAAAATPAAAASATPGFDLQMQNFSGDSGSWYNDDRTQYLAYTTFFSPTVHNAGPEAAPAGTVVIVRSDDRVLGAPTLTAFDGPDVPASAVTITGPETTGNSSTFTVVVTVPIPAGGSVRLRPSFGDVLTEEEASAIHDLGAAFSDLTPHSFTVSSPAGADADPSDDSISATAEVGEVVGWNGAITAVWASLDVDGCSYPYASAFVVESTGENPIPVDTQIYYSFDSRVVTALSVGSVSVDGTAVSLREGGIEVGDRNGYAYWFTTTAVAPGSTLRIELDSVVDSTFSGPVDSSRASGGLGSDESQSDTSDDSFGRETSCV